MTVVGARPQFIKAAPVSRLLRGAGHDETFVHTGQHYDYRMSQIFFEELAIPEPDVNLGVGSGSHGSQTAEMLVGLERVMQETGPDWVIVYGDTNTTLAGALAACKLGIRLAHVEAGLRSYNRTMPEEHNRILTDHCADLLFCPTRTAVANLEREGLGARARLVGDVMYDAVLDSATRAQQRSTVLRDLGVSPRGYALATIHRAYNTDQPENLRAILHALEQVALPVLLPLHPRTRERMAAHGLIHAANGNTRILEPVSYLDMLMLEQNAAVILTDSGGVQKEAYFFGVPCVTLRPETEWTETVAAGWNVIAGTEPAAIVSAVNQTSWPSSAPPPVFGDGKAAHNILRELTAAGHG